MSANAVDPLAEFIGTLREMDDKDAGRPPDFFDSPFTEIDGRFIVSREEWREYLWDLDKIRRAGHKYAVPREYPCYVTTAFVEGVWVHQTVGLSWLGYLEFLGMARRRAEWTPGQFGQRVRRNGER